MKQNFIIDSDWGGDVFQLTSILLARPKEFEILAATVVFGNANHDQHLVNAGALLRLLKADDKIPVFGGHKAPLGHKAPPQGDGAHGTDGLGGVKLPLSDYTPSDQHAVDHILETVANAPAGSITLIATGPQTNIAAAIKRDKQTMSRLKEIRIMGGCLNPISGYRLNANWNRASEELIDRFGNITEHAEFNFQQDPASAHIVLNSGIPITLFPMDCTHQLTFTPERQARLIQALMNAPKIEQSARGLIDAPRDMDGPKFGSASVMHDINTTISIIRPDLYPLKRGHVSINTDAQSPEFGRTKFTPDETGHIWAAHKITDPDAAFTEVVSALSTLYRQELQPRQTHRHMM